MAELTGAGESALKMRVKRACERLRDLLSDTYAILTIVPTSRAIPSSSAWPPGCGSRSASRRRWSGWCSTGCAPRADPSAGGRPIAAALAAGIAAAFAARRCWWVAGPRRLPWPSAGVRPIEFALRTPADSAVVLVGDFNDWNPAATPLHPRRGRRLVGDGAAPPRPLPLYVHRGRHPLAPGSRRPSARWKTTSARPPPSSPSPNGERMRPHDSLLLALGLLLRSPAAAAAQDPRLAARLDSATRAQVEAALASARGEGLPTEPLVQKALEGCEQGRPGSADRRRRGHRARGPAPRPRGARPGGRGGRARRGRRGASGRRHPVDDRRRCAASRRTERSRCRSRCSPTSWPAAWRTDAAWRSVAELARKGGDDEAFLRLRDRLEPAPPSSAPEAP